METIDNQVVQCIFMVDDDPLVLELMGEIIETLGYRVILCGSPKEAVTIFQEKHRDIDLAIIDMLMPEMNGRQLYQHMKKVDPDKKVIVLSGYAMESEVQMLLEEGLYGFVQKPISINDISQMIKQAIG